MEFCIESMAEGERRATKRIGKELTQELARLKHRVARMQTPTPEKVAELLHRELQIWMGEQQKLARMAVRELSGWSAA
ncbi:hypothetical protein ABH944_000911 [Caballeronia udeis]|uniref:Transposase n=1 Tax=Caballeronia udeis TaxID=1232866 RepID=A0ABW8MD75_9BURK